VNAVDGGGGLVMGKERCEWLVLAGLPTGEVATCDLRLAATTAVSRATARLRRWFLNADQLIYFAYRSFLLPLDIRVSMTVFLRASFFPS
jgi:hypothetical protein